jgi:UDP-glucuronate 4-epimerase
MRFLVTGTAGFVGFHLAKRLLDDGHDVVGIDGMTPYYDVELKKQRHKMLRARNKFQAHEFMLEDARTLGELFASQPFDVVIHLAAQAGVRYSLENPRAYIDANVIGTFNVLEMCRAHPVKHLLLASTSSVYGGNTKMPFAENDRTDHPLTLYAATKKATELMAHSYAHLWSIPTTAFRFFTVYGPWGRPDMALFKFTDGILKGRPIDIYNNGKMTRDFTYIDDLVEAIVRLVAVIPTAPVGAGLTDDDSLSPVAPFRVVNIGGGAPVELLAFIEEIEKSLGKKAVRNYMPMQMGDVPRTVASADLLQKLTGFKPTTPVSTGVTNFVTWFREYYSV